MPTSQREKQPEIQQFLMEERNTSYEGVLPKIKSELDPATTNLQEKQGQGYMLNKTKGMPAFKSRLWKTLKKAASFLKNKTKTAMRKKRKGI